MEEDEVLSHLRTVVHSEQFMCASGHIMCAAIAELRGIRTDRAAGWRDRAIQLQDILQEACVRLMN